MDAFSSFHSSSLKLKITCSLFLQWFSPKAEICNCWYPTVSDRMRLFNSSSKEIRCFISHKRHVVFCSWKFILLCKCYRNEALNIPGPVVGSEQTGIYCNIQGVMPTCSQENLDYRSPAADVESLDNPSTVVWKGRNAAVGWWLFLSSKPFLKLGFMRARGESSPRHPHTEKLECKRIAL